jgi:tetratricopeptide (TPR) repeat protein
MSADRARRSAGVAAALAAASALSLLQAAAALADDVPTAREAIEQALALERQGFVDEAALLLRDLVLEAGPLAEHADVLLELARLTPDVDAALEYVELALARSRDADVLARVHRTRGDFLFMQARYTEAAEEYERGARHGSGAAADALRLRRAASLAASEDASGAAEAYRALKENGDAPGERDAWAGLGLARALLTRGKVGEAAEEFERVADAHPDHDARPHALAGAVECHVAALRDSAAVAALTILEASYPASYEAVLARDLYETAVAARDTAAQMDGGEDLEPASD